MISDPNVFFLGTEEYNDEARIVFADGAMSLGDDPGEIDPTKGGDFDWHWSIEAGGGDWRLINEDTDEQFITARLSPTPDVKLQVHERTKFMSGVRDLTHHGDNVAFTDFTNLSFTDDDGEFARFERLGASDYELYLHEGATEERVFTTSDDGTFDAATLEGHALAEVAELDQDETVTGNWAFDGFITQDLAINADVTAELADVVSVDTVDFAADNGTVAGSEIITEAHPYYPDASDDTATASDVGLFHFGDDLAITETADGIQVDNVMATIPSDVYDDGTQVVADANGLDFVDPHISAIDQGNGIAEIGVSLPGTLLHSDVNETVSGLWTFNNQITGSIDHAVDADNATAADHASTADHATEADQADNSDALGGAGRQSFTENSGDETITGGWTFDTGPSVAAGQELGFGTGTTSTNVYYSEASSRLTFEHDDGSGPSRIAAFDPDEGMSVETSSAEAATLGLHTTVGSSFVAAYTSSDNAEYSRTIAFQSGAGPGQPSHQFNASGGGAMLSGPIEVGGSLDVSGGLDVGDHLDVGGSLTGLTNISFDPGSSPRFRYDQNLNGNAIHFQRETNSDETALTIEGTSVGVNGQTSPSYPLDVSGEGRFTSALYAHGGDQVATRPWTNSNFNNYTDSDAQNALSGTSPTFDEVSIRSGDRNEINFSSPSGGGIHLAGLIDYSNANDTRSIGIFAGPGDSNPDVEMTAGGTVYANSFVEGGDSVVSSSDGNYDIQKNGSDSNGVINFKTQ